MLKPEMSFKNKKRTKVLILSVVWVDWKKKVGPGIQTYRESIRKTSNNVVVLVTASQTSVNIIKIFSIKKSQTVEKDSNIYRAHFLGTYCTM